MKHSFNDKFKEREPVETAQMIQAFFADRGYVIKETFYYTEESEVWFCHLDLYLNNYHIMYSNGKGVTQEFCKASGYAELYERFCNKVPCIGNPFIMDKIMEKNFTQKGYYLHPEEKEISYDNCVQYLENALSFMEDSPGQFKFFANTITKNKYIGVPYKNVFNNNLDPLYLDPRILFRFVGSTGMAAGNTFIEAFNQGISEACEHYVRGQYFNENIKYYEIDLNNIKNKKLVSMINAIQNNNNELHIFDLSYNYQMPVLMSLLLNKKTHAITINYGAFPVFDIACERILTELYQGAKSFNNEKLGGLLPFRETKMADIITSSPSSVALRISAPEFLLTANNMIVEPNKDIFLFEGYDNQEIFNYYQSLFNKFNLEVYCFDASQSKDIYAIQIFVPYLNGLGVEKVWDEIQDKTKIYYYAFDLYHILERIFNNDIKAAEQCVYLSSLLCKLDNYEIYGLWNLCQDLWFEMGLGNEDILEILPLIFEETVDNGVNNAVSINVISSYQKSALFYKNLIKYVYLIRYMNCNKYSLEESKKILNALHFTFSEEDFLEYGNRSYITSKIVCEPLYNYYFGNDFDMYISSIL